jgi:hypothetical protein
MITCVRLLALFAFVAPPAAAEHHIVFMSDGCECSSTSPLTIRAGDTVRFGASYCDMSDGVEDCTRPGVCDADPPRLQ